jgi:Hemerythrin HHE cation binding domain
MAQRLRRATPGEAPATAAALLDFWRRAERRHLELEEDILVPALERHGLAEHPAVARMLVEHALIRRQVEEIASGASGTEQLRALGKQLAEHVRHEERAVFPLAEQRLGAKALAELGGAGAGRPRKRCGGRYLKSLPERLELGGRQRVHDPVPPSAGAARPAGRFSDGTRGRMRAPTSDARLLTRRRSRTAATQTAATTNSKAGLLGPTR